MYKKFTILLITLLIGIQSFGQLETGSISPNFITTDINGVEHNLYDLLDDGKIVILDFFATWCEPCWDLHEQETLKDIWNQYGPDGTNEVFIFSIESDLSTGSDQLNGIGGGTLGDWVTGTPFPVIDELEGTDDFGAISLDFNVNFYPAIYVICPDRVLTEENWQVTNTTFQNALQGGCASLDGENNVQILNYSGIEGAICEEANFTPTIQFQNFGNQNITSATAELRIDGTVQEQIQWTGDLVPYSIDTIVFSSLTVGSVDIDVELSNINGTTDDVPNNNIYNSSIVVPNDTDLDTVTVEIMTDFFGEETYWAIFDENEVLVAEGGNLAVGLDVTASSSGLDEPPADPNAYAGAQLYTTEVFLPSDGCYTFVIADFFEDGICCGLFGDGFYSVTSTDNGILIDGAGEFEHTTEAPFLKNASTVSTINIITGQLQLSPNPFVDNLVVDVSELESPLKNIQISNLTGRNVSTTQFQSINNNLIELNLGNYANGVYIIKLELEDGSIMVDKIVKQ